VAGLNAGDAGDAIDVPLDEVPAERVARAEGMFEVHAVAGPERGEGGEGEGLGDGVEEPEGATIARLDGDEGEADAADSDGVAERGLVGPGVGVDGEPERPFGAGGSIGGGDAPDGLDEAGEHAGSVRATAREEHVAWVVWYAWRMAAFNAQPGEQYTLRRQVFKFFGAGFHVYDPRGGLVAYCKQKAFKLKEDLRLYTDDTCSTEVIRIAARSIIDFGATYDIMLPDGTSLGSLRQKGLSSAFVRDHWLVFDQQGNQVAELQEIGGWLPMLRRWVEWVAILSPQKFDLRRMDGTVVATFRQHFNPFVYRLGITIHADDERIDDLMILATACLIGAIEGRQANSW